MTCLEEVEKLGPSCASGGNVKCGSHCGNSLDDPQKLNIESLCTPAIPFLGTSPKEGRSGGLKRYLHTRVHSSLIHNSQKVGTPQVSMNS